MILYDVLIVGGGPAGLAAALTLGRVGRSALVCDNSRPRNSYSKNVFNFPGMDGIPPKQWRRLAQLNLRKYKTIQTVRAQVTSISKRKGFFVAKLDSGLRISCKKVLLAYGLHNKFPLIPGFKKGWGNKIFHCPYCHGYESRGKALGLLADSIYGIPLMLQFSKKVILFTNGKKLKPKDHHFLHENSIELFENKLKAIASSRNKGAISISMVGGEIKSCDALFYVPNGPFQQASSIGLRMGCKLDRHGLLQVNEFAQTTVADVYACGDICSFQHSVLSACASGANASFNIVNDFNSEFFENFEY